MVISIQAIIDPIIDPKHELLTEIVGRYFPMNFNTDFSISIFL
jgi:hypothetical protein